MPLVGGATEGSVQTVTTTDGTNQTIFTATGTTRAALTRIVAAAGASALTLLVKYGSGPTTFTTFAVPAGDTLELDFDNAPLGENTFTYGDNLVINGTTGATVTTWHRVFKRHLPRAWNPTLGNNKVT